jgi:hypothetical protein
MTRFPWGPGVIAAVLSITTVSVHAQTTATSTSQPQPDSPPTPSPTSTSSIDPTKLGISFDRVRMQLTEATSEPTKTHGLKIAETIEVVGKAPKIELWNPETAKLTSNAVPFGAPTQKDIQKLIVPKEFQNYPFDLNALMQWLMEHLNKKTE